MARRAGDEKTVQVIDEILVQERSAAAIIASEFDRALEASLRAQGVAAA